MVKDEHLQEWHDASAAVGALARDEKDFTTAVEAFDNSSTVRLSQATSMTNARPGPRQSPGFHR